MPKIKKNENQGKREYIFAVGRRREAIARVRLYSNASITLNEKTFKKGSIIVNEKPIEDYFGNQASKELYLKPFQITKTLGKFIVTIKAEGGGLVGQLGAVVHGISRALEKYDSKNRPVLKKEGLLTRDPRTRERRKIGTGGKARRKKQSPKR